MNCGLDPATAMEFVACDGEKGLPHRLDLLVLFVTDRALIFAGPLIPLSIAKIAGYECGNLESGQDGITNILTEV